jgi:diguanylate cyclase (GGDEF)-like protein
MIPPTDHPQEQVRLESLYRHQILDTGPDQTFDDLANLAAQLCGVPIALVSLVDRDRQWFKARVGLDITQTDRDVSFCGHAICHDEKTFVVEDASKDERFHDNPLVTQDNGIRFYAGAKVFDDQGLPMGTLCIIDDKPQTFSDEQRKQLEQLANQVGRQMTLHRLLRTMSEASEHDELTGLLNRRGLMAHMNRFAPKTQQRLATIYLDLQRFKPINDSFGHTAGDLVLQQVAERLQHATDETVRLANGTTAVVSRIGGDEFVVSLVTRHDAKWVQNTLARNLINAINEPYPCNGSTLHVGAVAGVAASLPGERVKASLLISNADIAMCQAKAAGQPIMSFDQAMREHIDHEMQIEASLRQAVQQDAITAAFEPILDLHTGRVLGFECLARWTDPALGKVRPDQFIPIAERTGLIDQVFQSVVNQALATCKEVTEQSPQDLFFSVNLSKAQLTDDRLFDQLTALTDRHGVDPSQLHLEVTESLVASSDAMIDKLHRLRKLGHPLMLDDFGTGTSSLSCLKAYPVQWIKIDHQLTDAAHKSRQYAAIIQAVADLASNLQMHLVAEGVEQAETIPMLQGMDVSAAQGWFWTKPLQPAEVAAWLTAHNKASRKRIQAA